MEDDDPVLGHDADEDERPAKPPLPGMAMGAAAVAVVAVIVISSGASPPGTAETAAPTTSSTTTTVPTRPSVSVPPTAPPGEVVDQTLRWEQPVGLEDAVDIGGITHFQGSYWIVGTTADGVGAWTSDGSEGAPWKLVSNVEQTEGWFVDDVEVIGGRLAATASSRNGASGIFESTDGTNWEQISLETDDASRPRAVVTDLVPLDGGVVLTGGAHAAPPPDALFEQIPEPAAELIRSGDAWLNVRPHAIVISIQPGVEIARITEPEFPEGYQPGLGSTPQIWRGEDIRTAVPVETSAVPRGIVTNEEGLLFGQLGNRIAVSTDGRDWDTTGPVTESILSFTPWKDGLAIDRWEDGAVYWTPDSDELAPLLPYQVRTARQPTGLTTSGGWGLALARADTRPSDPDRVLITSAADGELYLQGDGRLEFVRDGEGVWSREAYGGSVTLDPDGSLLVGEEPDQVSVDVAEWVEAFEHLRRVSHDLTLVHTPDGEIWSSMTWEEITGLDTVGSPSLRSTDEFLLVVDGGAIGSTPLNGMAIGRPTDL